MTKANTQIMLWTGVAVAVALIAVWPVPASRGAPRRSDQLEADLEYLLNCSLEQAFLSIRPKFAANKFLQFDRHPMSDDRLGLWLTFPNATWSDNYFPQIVTAASKQDLKYEIQGLVFELLVFSIRAVLTAPIPTVHVVEEPIAVSERAHN